MFYFESLFLNENTKVEVLKSTLLKNVNHFFTTRDFVLTAGNLPIYNDLAKENRSKLCSHFGIPQNKLFVPIQTHSSNIVVNPKESDFLENTDAIILSQQNSATLLNFADCTPIIIHDPINNIGAVVHAGWRGTAQAIVQKTIAKLIEYFSVNPSQLVCAIGPTICKKCYCVNEDVYNKIKNTIRQKEQSTFEKVTVNDEEKYLVDLKLVNKIQLNEVGVNKIDISEFCTYCDSDKFFSYRKELGKTARHSAVLILNGEK